MTPDPARFLALRALIYLALLTVARLALVARFASDMPGGAFAKALLLGLRFDARLVAVLTLAALPFVFFERTAPWSPSRIARRVWLGAETLVAFALAVFIIVDFGHYAYLTERINAGLVGLVRDVREAAGMVWQSYPVLPLALLAGAITAGCVWAVRHVARRAPHAPRSGLRTAARVSASAVVCAACLHGSLGQYPLRWSSAAELPRPADAMSLNPVLNFFDTLAFMKKGPRPGDELPYRELMQRRLGADGAGVTPYERLQPGSPSPLPANLNVVVVLMESFSGYRSSVFGNPLDPTPVMARLAREGVSFDRHFTSHVGTARGVFALMTGVPDVQLGNTASRNPRAARHRFPLEDAGFAEKHYFIGGSTSWANVRGVLLGTVPDLRIHEETDLKSPRSDVWGVADGDLLPEAAEVLGSAKRPFFAVIQTANNHRPYTIPDRHLAAVPRARFTPEQLEAAGFEDSTQVDGFRYMDWSVGRLLESAKKAGWHDDTLFVFLGDHGIAGKAGGNMPDAFRALVSFTSCHTPLILYCPGHLKPARVSAPAMQADVLPLVAALLGKPTVQRGMGRDVLAPGAVPPVAFTIDHSRGPEISLFDGRFQVVTGPGETDPVKLYDTESANVGADVSARYPANAAELARLVRAHYQSAAYMLTNNGKETRR